MVLRVNIGGPAHLYTNAIPVGMMAIGTVTRKSGHIGALVRYQGGAYAQINGATVCPLDRREVVSAMIEARADQDREPR
jgi:hypothetical protein